MKMEEHQIIRENLRNDGQAVLTKLKRTPKFLRAGALVVVVIGAIYAVGRFLGDNQHGDGSPTIIDMAGGATMTQLERAEELPLIEPVVWGIVDHLDDNSVFVTPLPPLDQIMLQGSVDYGPTIEVVVTSKTTIYAIPPYDPPVNGAIIVEKVVPGSVDDIEASNLVSVWGEKRGDRIVAEVLSYNNHSKIWLPSGPIN
jgi:hypothetical protein